MGILFFSSNMASFQASVCTLLSGFIGHMVHFGEAEGAKMGAKMIIILRGNKKSIFFFKT